MKHTKADNITEAQFQSQIKDLAKMFGFLFYHTWKSYHSPQGFPDVCMAKPPRLIFAELKSETGQLTIDQHIWLQILQNCPGVEAYLWRPSDFEEIVSILQS